LYVVTAKLKPLCYNSLIYFGEGGYATAIMPLAGIRHLDTADFSKIRIYQVLSGCKGDSHMIEFLFMVPFE